MKSGVLKIRKKFNNINKMRSGLGGIDLIHLKF